MNLMTEPVIKQPRHSPDTRTAKDWLDGLASGACDQRTFLRGLGELLGRSTDSGWDMLALIDQYYRRGKITAETFTTIKGHLQNLLLGKTGGSEPAPQIPTVRDELVKAPAISASVVALPTAEARGPGELRGGPAAIAAGSRPAVEPIRPRVERTPVEGDVLRGRYRLQRLLGRGATGSVFEAVDLSRIDETGREQQVAVKVLHSVVVKRPRLLAELRREFQHLQALSHPNIVRVHEFDRDGDLAFFTMEYLPGASLRVIAGDHPRGLRLDRALAMVRDIGAALAHAHSRGMAHGNLNPGNIMVTVHGDLRVLDFGATPALRRAPAHEDAGDEHPIMVDQQTFASCEVLEGNPADTCDDVYSLACIAYLLLAGHHPFQDISSLKARSLGIAPRRPRGLNRRQWSALRAGLQLDRTKRPADATAWAAELDGNHTTRGQRPAASHRRIGGLAWIFAVAALTLLGTAAWWLNGHDDGVQLRTAQWRDRVTAFLHADRDGQPDVRETPSAHSAGRADAVSSAPPDPAPVAGEPTPASRPAEMAEARTPETVAFPAPAPVAAARVTTLPAAPRSAPTAALPTDSASSPGARARIELASDNVEVSPDDSTARVTVRRTRSLKGDATFSWWTESGTAKPGQDFVAVKSHVETIPNGKAAVTLLVPIVMDPARHQERNFYIVIDEPSDNAVLGNRTLTMVTIPGPPSE